MGAKRNPGKVRHDVPLQLPPQVAALLGDEADSLLEALGQEPPVSIRLNPAKPVPLPGTPVPWSIHGRYLPERPVFTLDPLFHAGAYYVQEASSMLLEQAVKACGPLPERAVVLDLCAAPGGKATHLASLIPKEALLLANEVVAGRRAVLADNLWKWGRDKVVITGADPGEFGTMGNFCDLVLVDAPCSGEGMFRKDPHARAQWGPNLVETCARRQQGILDDAWRILNPGGYLIYSTCTWETAENEDQVERMVRLGAEKVAIPTEGSWGVQATSGGWRCYPHKLRGEGFFIALLRKPVAGAAEGGQGVKHAPVPVDLPDEVKPWLRALETLRGIQMSDTLHVVPEEWAPLVRRLTGTLRVDAPGTPVAVRRGGQWLPHPALALSGLCAQGVFPALDLDGVQALRYLRGEAMPAHDAAGAALVRFQGLGLGWVQGAGNRWNNRWPAPWRIRMR